MIDGLTTALQGVQLNEVYLLDVTTFTWQRAPVVGASPVGRAWHCAAVVAGRMVVACGESALGPTDIVVTLTSEPVPQHKPVLQQQQQQNSLFGESGGSWARSPCPVPHHMLDPVYPRLRKS